MADYTLAKAGIQRDCEVTRTADMFPKPRLSGESRNPERLGREMKVPCVYILTSKRNGTPYVCVTSNLVQRIWQNKNDLMEGFTKRYRVDTFV